MRPVFIFILALFAFAGTARAQVEDLPSAVMTSTHVGYGMMARSSEGFTGVGGSLAFFDVSLPLLDGLDGGLRSLAQGARTASSQLYRLGSGPFLSWEAFEDIFLQLTVNAYRESLMDADGHRVKDRFGRTLMAGTQRFFYRSPRIDAGWGGFTAWHDAGRVGSMTHGVDLSLRLRL